MCRHLHKSTLANSSKLPVDTDDLENNYILLCMKVRNGMNRTHLANAGNLSDLTVVKSKLTTDFTAQQYNVSQQQRIAQTAYDSSA